MKPAYKPVLCVVSSHPIKGASGVPTGFFLAELTHPLKVLEDAGIKTTIFIPGYRLKAYSRPTSRASAQRSTPGFLCLPGAGITKRGSICCG